MQIIWIYNKDCKLDMLKDYGSNEGNSMHYYYNIAVCMGRRGNLLKCNKLKKKKN